MNIDPQIAAVKAAQGAVAIEQQLLGEAFVGPPAPTSTPGVNATKRLALASGHVVFHKPFSGVHIANAVAYGQTDETPPLHDAVGWRFAVALGSRWQDLVAPCVLRDYAGDDGALSLQAPGWPGDPAPTQNPSWCVPAAFFDSLIAQQDRHPGNWRWDGHRLTLIDHGYRSRCPARSSTTPTSSQLATATVPPRWFRKSGTHSAGCSTTRSCSAWQSSYSRTEPKRSQTGHAGCLPGTRSCKRASSEMHPQSRRPW